MTKFFCDHCQKEFPSYSLSMVSIGIDTRYHLCNSCMLEFERWVKPNVRPKTL